MLKQKLDCLLTPAPQRQAQAGGIQDECRFKPERVWP